ncbi:MAG: glycosyltransferase family 2 protein [Nitrospirae bacterium]|nr:glycosyltransferase family 2 protein [Nitrospirota bacterium]
MIKLSVLIPVYNGEATIDILCERLMTQYRKAYDLEIVLVNDNSSDRSGEICTRLHEDHPETITYITLSRNFGEHNALMAGLNNVTGDYCVMMDDDLQNPPEEVGRLVGEIERGGYDVVYSYYAEKKDALLRNLGSKFNDKMANLVLKKPVDLYLSSFKVVNRFLINEVIRYSGPDPYIDGIILRTTSNIGRVLVEHRSRNKGRSGYTLGKLISIWGNMVVSYSIMPLRAVGFFGLIMTLFGLYHGGNTIIEKIFYPDQTSEYETLMSVIVFFRGFQLLAISVVGEYVGRIYLSLHNDPQFVVRHLLRAHKQMRTPQTDKISRIRLPND